MFTALAIARDLQTRTGVSIRKIIRTLRPLRHVTINIAGHTLEAAPTIPDEAHHILHAAGH